MRLREDAEEMLKAIEDSSRETNDAYEKLKDGYLRLWKLGALKGFDELRICLFRLILCSFTHLSVERLTCLLQNRIGSLSVSETEILYSNFLVSDVGEVLRFTHNSAREFVVREILGTISGGSQESLSSLVMKENHRSIAKLFVDFIQRSDNQDRREMSEAFDLSYFKLFGLRHCKYAAEKQSIFDNVWSDIIQRVLLPVASRLAADIVSAFPTPQTVFRYRHIQDSRLIFRDCGGKSYLLFSHTLVWLGIIHPDDASDPRLENLETASSDTSTPKGVLRHFAKGAAMKSTGANANALHIACLYGRENAAAVNLILRSTYYLYGKDTCTNLLSQQIYFEPDLRVTPFALALINHYMMRGQTFSRVLLLKRNFDVMKTLLSFESRYLATADDREKANSSQASHRAQQWSHSCVLSSYGPAYALTCAVLFLKEETVCDLLKIAKPIAINEFDKFVFTPLAAAASLGRLIIMRILVEDWHTDLNVWDRRGKSALDVAREEKKQAVADYLEKRMGISVTGQSVDLTPEVKENTF